MTDLRWFSAKARLVVLVEGTGATRYADSLFLFRSADFDSALQRAIELGKQQEKEYVGGEGKRVRFRLKEIVSLDVIPDDNLDGAEVYSEPVDLPPGESAPFDATFDPSRSRPTQTI
jgi:hypothetical protein